MIKTLIRGVIPFALLLCIVLWRPGLLRAQQSMLFNRFQYHKLSWKVLPTAAFRLYYPAGCDSLASFASVQLPDIMAEVKKSMGTGVRELPNLILYPSPVRQYETNVGLYETGVLPFPVVSLKGSRALVSFSGSYEQFRLQLAEAWTRLCWEEQFRNDAEEQLTNRKQTVPAWFRRGSIRYFAAGWSLADEDALCRRLSADTAMGWEQLAEQEPVLAGQGLCYFLAQRYGEDVPKQALFQLRQGKTLNRALRLVCKRTADTLTGQCLRYFRERSGTCAPQSGSLASRLERQYQGKIFRMSESPDKRSLCFVIAQKNRRVVYVTTRTGLADTTRKAAAALRYVLPPWSEAQPYDCYPLLSWADDGQSVFVVLPDKGNIQLLQLDTKGQQRDRYTLYGVDGVGSFSVQDRGRFLLSAYRRGSSAIVIYDTRRLRYLPLTSGNADHTEARLLPGNVLAYRSGYPADSLYYKDTLARPYGIYYKQMTEPKATAGRADVPWLLDSAFIRWEQPAAAGSRQVSVLNSAAGKWQRDTLAWQQPVVTPVLYRSPWLSEYLKREKTKDSVDAFLQGLKDHEEVSVLKNILTPGDNREAALLQQDSIRRALAYTAKKVRPYVLQLHSAYFSAQINNDYYINRYQPFRAYLGTFNFPSVGAMANGGFSDLFEHHHFNIGYRLPAGSEGSDFFVRYANTARKLDWHLLFFRKVESLQPDPERDWKDNKGNPYPQAAKVKTHYYELGFHYPLQYDWSLDFTTAARRDRTIFLANDRYSLQYEALQSWWSMNSLVLRVNKLEPVIPFLFKGWEGKLMLDGMASTGKNATLLYGTRIQLARHQPLPKQISLVVQAQGGYSGGQSHILYNFGGLDNNVVPRVDTAVRFAQDAPYAFQSLITPLRGYEQNSTYGSSFVLLNADLYFPLFRSLIPLRTGFSSVNNLQLGLFTDIAATRTAPGQPSVKSPLYAYGFSARTMLAGYPLRFDMAWPGTFDKKPVWYLSLSLR